MDLLSLSWEVNQQQNIKGIYYLQSIIDRRRHEDSDQSWMNKAEIFYSCFYALFFFAVFAL